MLEAFYGPQDDLCYHAGWKRDFADAFMITDVGRKRQNNEDSCVICAPRDEGLQQSRGFFFGVADGMGGASAGEYASCKCLEYACRTYFDKSRHALVPAMMRMPLSCQCFYLPGIGVEAGIFWHGDDFQRGDHCRELVLCGPGWRQSRLPVERKQRTASNHARSFLVAEQVAAV